MPKPFDDNQGWTKNGDMVEPLWSSGPILPQFLIDVVENTVDSLDEINDDEEVEEEEIDYDEIFSEELEE